MVNCCEFCGASLDPGERCDCHGAGLALRCVQAPVISEDLEEVRRQLDSVLAEVGRLPKNDESLKRVRAIRAELSKRFGALEAQRKEVKRQVLQPYTDAEEKYKVCIADPYRAADGALKDWVDGYQNRMKQDCRKRLQEYFDSLCAAQGVDFLHFSDCGITVDMAMARQEEPKKAMKSIESMVKKVREDLDTICTLEDSAEVLAEYRVSLDLSQAIVTVKRRKEQAAEMEHIVQTAKQGKQQEQAHRESLLAEAPELKNQEESYTVSFTVTGSKPELKALKAYILSHNLRLEDDK